MKLYWIALWSFLLLVCQSCAVGPPVVHNSSFGFKIMATDAAIDDDLNLNYIDHFVGSVDTFLIQFSSADVNGYTDLADFISQKHLQVYISDNIGEYRALGLFYYPYDIYLLHTTETSTTLLQVFAHELCRFIAWHLDDKDGALQGSLEGWDGAIGRCWTAAENLAVDVLDSFPYGGE